MGLLEKVVLFTAVYVPATVFTNVFKINNVASLKHIQ